jgi:hypothetical protein
MEFCVVVIYKILWFSESENSGNFIRLMSVVKELKVFLVTDNDFNLFDDI